MADWTTTAPGIVPPPARTKTYDMARAALFVAIPVYSRIFLFSSLVATLSHLYIVGTTLISTVHFSKDEVVSTLAWDVFYGLVNGATRAGLHISLLLSCQRNRLRILS
jgi:hypothetical protein